MEQNPDVADVHVTIIYCVQIQTVEIYIIISFTVILASSTHLLMSECNILI